MRRENQYYVSRPTSSILHWTLNAHLVYFVAICEPPTQEDYQNGLTKKQLVMELDYRTWKVSDNHVKFGDVENIISCIIIHVSCRIQLSATASNDQ